MMKRKADRQLVLVIQQCWRVWFSYWLIRELGKSGLISYVDPPPKSRAGRDPVFDQLVVAYLRLRLPRFMMDFDFGEVESNATVEQQIRQVRSGNSTEVAVEGFLTRHELGQILSLSELTILSLSGVSLDPPQIR